MYMYLVVSSIAQVKQNLKRPRLKRRKYKMFQLLTAMWRTFLMIRWVQQEETRLDWVTHLQDQCECLVCCFKWIIIVCVFCQVMYLFEIIFNHEEQFQKALSTNVVVAYMMHG